MILLHLMRMGLCFVVFSQSSSEIMATFELKDYSLGDVYGECEVRCNSK